ncbi:MAG: glycine cleavage system protein T [Chloroflexota bacterium]
MTLYEAQNAVRANDGIPLHFGDLAREYQAALHDVVLMDRSHEGRFEIGGRDRLALLHRISTNDLLTLAEGEGRPTLFTNANARILDRATVYHRGERALILTEPGRGDALMRYLQRNIFFNDDAQVHDQAQATRQLVLHGVKADAVGWRFAPELAAMHGANVTIAGAQVWIGRDKAISGGHWRLIVANDAAEKVWTALLDAGAEDGLIPAGSLTYNAVRIRAGRPGVGRELSAEYIPLEVGLWDEVSFTKGCYTGQEIIARMESRGKLAKTIVTLRLNAWVEAPAKITLEGREIGMLTSSVQTPDGNMMGIGVIKVAAALVGAQVTVGETGTAEITALAGAQPPG